MSTERERLNEVPRGRAPWRHWGPYLASGLGHGARGLQRRRRRLGLLPARPRPLARLPLERGRPRRASATTGRRSASRSRSGTAATRSSRSGSSASPAPRATTARTPRSTGGTSTRRPTHSWMRWRYMYPQAEFPYERLVAENARARQARARVRARSTPASSTTAATGRSPSTTRRPSPEDILHPRLACATPGPRRRRSTCCRRSGSATPGRGASTTATPSIRARERRARRRAPRPRHARACSATASPEPLFCDNETNARAALGRRRARRRTRRTASTTTSSTAPPTVNPAQTGHEGGVPLPARGRAPARRPTIELRLGDRGAGLGDDFDAGHGGARARRPTSSTPS